MTFFKDLERQGALPQRSAEEAADFFTGLVTQDWLLRSLLLSDAALPEPETFAARVAAQVERYFGAASSN